MQTSGETVHTTLNLSRRLMSRANRLFRGKTKTEIIHQALERMVQVELLERHVLKWKGRGRLKVHG